MKKSIALMACLALTLTLAACAKKAEKPTAAAAPAEPAKNKNAVVMGGEYLCPDFNMTIAAGWAATLDTEGKVDVLPTEEKGPGLHFTFERGAAGTAEEAVAAVIAAENGSSMGTATINDVEFKTTTYTRHRMTHTVYAAFRNGVKIMITADAKGGKIERDLGAMLSTVQFRSEK
jgi:hypothetical protein